jgi:3-hydroxyisobutyrate dehydrogenase-like beta-hydroxyacid dehydrogenase
LAHVSHDTFCGHDGLVTSVAVIGLGAMGGRFARRFLDAGHEVVVWNRSPEKAVELIERGARSARSPADAARRAEAVITMVSDTVALRAVTEGPEGLAAGADGSTTVIEMSTVGPAAIERLESNLPDEAGLLDAPVLGSLSEAESGSLQVFVGGPDELFERWSPLLSVLGSPIHVGSLGTGATAKLVANATLVGTLTLLGETVALADRLGLSRGVTFEVLAATPLAPQAQRRRDALDQHEFPRHFGLALGRKDADLIVDEAGRRGADVRVLEAARRWFTEADEAGWGEKDYSEVLAWIIEEH